MLNYFAIGTAVTIALLWAVESWGGCYDDYTCRMEHRLNQLEANDYEQRLRDEDAEQERSAERNRQTWEAGMQRNREQMQRTWEAANPGAVYPGGY